MGNYLSNFTIFTITAIFIMVAVGCDISEKGTVVNTDERLTLIHVYDLDVPEPSGLALNANKSALYVVSDPDDNKVRKISLTGQVLETLSYNGDDIEGITVDSDESLWIVEERLREIVHLDQNGIEINRVSVNFQGDENTGFEGITIGHSGNVFVLNEKNPGLILEINASALILNETEPGTALDYSGICYVPEIETFFIVSDESKRLLVFNNELEQTNVLAFAIEKAEGVDYDPLLNRLYIVSDKEEKLYVYELNLNQESGNKRR